MEQNTKAFLDNAIETALTKAREDIETKIKRKAAIDLSAAFTGLIAAGIVSGSDVKEVMDEHGLSFTYNPSDLKKKNASYDDDDSTPARPVRSSSNYRSTSSC